MFGKTRFLFLFFCLFFGSAFSQEICNNGIDDDGDGLIDLNDSVECVCSTALSNIIPNPSFENHTCCPSTFSQMNCCINWMQASGAGDDYQNTCNYVFGAATAAGLVPFPDGNGITGTLYSTTWKEYIGTCLNSPLLAGVTYTLQYYIASTPINATGGVCNGGAIVYTAISLPVYGTTNCANIPFGGTSCPPSPAFQLLASTNYTPVSTWGLVSFTFTPAVNINGIVLGSPCALPGNYNNPGGCYPYFYYDGISIHTITVSITSIGSYCTHDLVLFSHSDTVGGSWQWFHNGISIVGETDSVLSVSANNYGAGTYTVLQSTGSGCRRATHLVTGTTLGVSIVSQTNVNCTTGAGGSAAASGSGGTGPLTYSWNTTPVQSGTAATNLPAGNFTVTVHDSLGCSSSNSVNITQNALAPLNNPQTICSDQLYSINLHNYNLPGNYYDTLQTSGGCDSIIFTQLVVHSIPMVSVSNDITVCPGTSIVLSASGGVSYLWSPTTGLIDPTNSVTNAFSSTSIKYYVFVTDIHSCVNTDSVLVTVLPLPVADAGNDQTICAGTEIILSASGGISYLWSPTTGMASSTDKVTNAFPTNSTRYVVTVTDTNSCKNSDSVLVSVLPLPAINAGPDQTICEGTSTFLTGSGGGNYFWSPNVSLSSTSDPIVVASPISATNYLLLVTEGNGCTNTDSVHITVSSLPSAGFIPDSIRGDKPFSVHFTDISIGAENFHWEFGDGYSDSAANPVHVYHSAGVYTVRLIVVSSDGCPDTAQFQFIEVNSGTHMMIPNIFTPGSDGTNDFFKVEWKGFTQLNAKIFNRWGLRVADTDLIQNGWNGVMPNGKEADDGVYYYIITGVGNDHQDYEFHGCFELIR